MQTSAPPAAPPRAALPEHLQDAWRRCQRAGLQPDSPLPAQPDSDSALYALRQRHRSLLRAASPLMARLARQLTDCGSAVLLCNADGVVLHRLGPPAFLDELARLGLHAGADWRESRCGVNAMGSALAAGRALTVHGPEHYLHALRQLTCAAVPLALPGGARAGALGIVGPCRHRQPHTLALVQLAANEIELRLLDDTPGGAWLLQLRDDDEQDCRLVFADDGRWLAGCGEGRARFAALGAPDDARHFEQLFAAPFEWWTQLARRAPERRQPLQDQLARDWRGCLRPLAAGDDDVFAPPPPSHGLPRHLLALTGGDAQLDAAARRALRLVGKDIPLLIEGETGTGKEVFAQAFHASSPRRDGPFVAVNCAAIQEGLIESELFGYEDGAFTGARRKGHVGRIAQAHGGTLFLDEIGDMPLSLQAHLLRVLQEREVTPLGAQRAQTVDIAVVCATHRDLRQAVADGRFREDLYYRLAGVRVRLPALRERSDRAELCQRLLLEENHGEAVALSPALCQWLDAHPWPGNLRQLRSVLRSALASREHPDDALDLRHLDEDAPSPPRLHLAPSPDGRLADIEQRAILHTLSACAGNMSAAARQLGISRATLYRRLRGAAA